MKSTTNGMWGSFSGRTRKRPPRRAAVAFSHSVFLQTSITHMARVGIEPTTHGFSDLHRLFATAYDSCPKFCRVVGLEPRQLIGRSGKNLDEWPCFSVFSGEFAATWRLLPSSGGRNKRLQGRSKLARGLGGWLLSV